MLDLSGGDGSGTAMGFPMVNLAVVVNLVVIYIRELDKGALDDRKVKHLDYSSYFW